MLLRSSGAVLLENQDLIAPGKEQEQDPGPEDAAPRPEGYPEREALPSPQRTRPSPQEVEPSQGERKSKGLCPQRIHRMQVQQKRAGGRDTTSWAWDPVAQRPAAREHPKLLVSAMPSGIGFGQEDQRNENGQDPNGRHGEEQQLPPPRPCCLGCQASQFPFRVPLLSLRLDHAPSLARAPSSFSQEQPVFSPDIDEGWRLESPPFTRERARDERRGLATGESEIQTPTSHRLVARAIMDWQLYDPAEVEARWQRFWDIERTFFQPNPGDPGFKRKLKYYVLDMFPYPSGAGLHVGHPKGYTASDVIARYNRHMGYNVLHPMGWDAFGLPAEQHAIETGTHPAETTAKNIGRFREQLQRLGFSYDWSRQVNTTDPAYYRWTQWIFTQLHQKGLAYMAEIPVWWCEKLGTVLANEEVTDGRSERGNYPCEKRPMRQWMLRITKYADELLTGLRRLRWPKSVKAMQTAWIGKSEGAIIQFPVAGQPKEKIEVYTTRPDTLFGATYLVLAPEHPMVERLTSPDYRPTVEAYKKQASKKSDLDRTELNKDKTGTPLGSWVLNPAYAADDPKAKIPIWIADYVLVSSGTGAVMAVPGSDERDFDFAMQQDLPIVTVVDGGEKPKDPAKAVELGFVREAKRGDETFVCFTGSGRSVNSESSVASWNRLPTKQAKARAIIWLKEAGVGIKNVNYRLRDWLFSRQRYWGEPFPILHMKDGTVRTVPERTLPVTLPMMTDFSPSGNMEPPLAKATEWVRTYHPYTREEARRETNTMPQWAGSCWYYLRFMDPFNPEELVSKRAMCYWGQVDMYIGGAEHAVLHLLYARFWHRFLHEIGVVDTKEPFRELVNQGMVQSHAYKDSRGAIVAADLAIENEDGSFTHKETGEALERIVAKMSKSLKNVQNPDDVIEKYGADTFRLYELFMGPLEASSPWNPDDIPGVHRFLKRIWRLVVPEHGPNRIHPHLRRVGRRADPEIERELHATIFKVTIDLNEKAFNTAISAMMVFVNTATKGGVLLTAEQMQTFLILLDPFAPHIAEELLARIRGEFGDPTRSIAFEKWPAWNIAITTQKDVQYVVQINGKLRKRMEAGKEDPEDILVRRARDLIYDQLEGKEIIQEIFVPGKLVNFVVK